MMNPSDNTQLTKSFKFIAFYIMIGVAFSCIVSVNISNDYLSFLVILLLPGTCHGLMQMHMLSRYTSRAPNVWFAITLGSASLGVGIALIILKYVLSTHALENFFTISNNIPASILKGIIFGTVVGSFIGSVIAVTQWFFARKIFNLPHWLFATATSWSIGLAIPLALLLGLVASMSGFSHIEF